MVEVIVHQFLAWAPSDEGLDQFHDQTSSGRRPRLARDVPRKDIQFRDILTPLAFIAPNEAITIKPMYAASATFGTRWRSSEHGSAVKPWRELHPSSGPQRYPPRAEMTADSKLFYFVAFCYLFSLTNAQPQLVKQSTPIAEASRQRLRKIMQYLSSR